MKKNESRTQAKDKIISFFTKDKFSARDVKKIIRLANRHRIRLGKLRQNFCKKCFSKLEGKIRIKHMHKIIKCGKCGFLNKFKIKKS